MSTSGSYKFKDKFNDIMIHKTYDNHPQAAARILHDCYHDSSNAIGNSLHRNYNDTTIISNRDAYTSDEYRYDIHQTSSDINIKAYKRDCYNGKDVWAKVYEGNLIGFFNTYYEEQK